MSKLKVAGSVIAILVGIVTLLDYLKIMPVCNFLANCEPKFKFTYEGTGKPIYEVAEGLAYSDENNTALLPFSITVEVLQYSGNQYSGEMNVIIEWLDKDKNKHQEIVEKWDSFRNQYQTPVKIKLFPNKLYQYAVPEGGIPQEGLSAYTWDTQEPVKGYFDIVVRYNDGTELVRQTVTVAYTPWYHEALLDSAVVRLNHDIKAHVKVVNLGEPSKFKVTALVYDTTTPDISSITDGQSWWLERTWTTTVYSADIITDTAIGTKKDYVTSFAIPADTFKEGRTYALSITTMKELPYLKFANSNDTWSNSGERWRYRDTPIYLSFFVVK